MDKKIEREIEAQGLSLEPVRNAEHLLGYDPIKSIKAGNLEAVIKRMKQEATNTDINAGLKRTGAWLKCLIADYTIRAELKKHTEADTDILAIEQEVLRQMMVDEPKRTMVWQD